MDEEKKKENKIALLYTLTFTNTLTAFTEYILRCSQLLCIRPAVHLPYHCNSPRNAVESASF